MELYYDEIDGDVLVIAADGGLNAQTTEEFVANVQTLVDTGLTKIIIDCSKLSLISSYGLGVLVRLHSMMKKRGGNVKVCGVRGIVAQALQVTNLTRLLEIYPDVDRARLAFRPKAGSDAP